MLCDHDLVVRGPSGVKFAAAEVYADPKSAIVATMAGVGWQPLGKQLIT